MSKFMRHILYSNVRFSQNYIANSEKVVFFPPSATPPSFLAAAKDDFKRQRTGPGTRVASRSSVFNPKRSASGGTRG